MSEFEGKYRTNNYEESINKLKILIPKYKEIIASRGNFIDKTQEEKEKTKAIFQIIKDVLNELRKIKKFDNRAEKLTDIYEDIIKRYKEIHEEDFSKSLEDVDGFISMYGSKKNSIYADEEKSFSEDEDSKKIPSIDIIKIDEENKREQKRKNKEIVLSNDIDMLINAMDKFVDIFFQEYGVLQQEQSKQEVENTNDLIVIMPKKHGIQDFLSKLIEKIKLFFFRKSDVVIDVPYQEVDNKSKDFRDSVLLEDKNKLALQEESILFNNDLYEEMDKDINSKYDNDSHTKFYKKVSNIQGNTKAKVYLGKINNTEVVANDLKKSNGSITIIKIKNRYFCIKITDKKIEYIEEIPIKDKYSSKIYNCELYITPNTDGKSNTIVYDENRGGFVKNTYSVQENEDGTFLVEIKGKYKYNQEGTHSCKLLYNSKNDFLEKEKPIEITCYDLYNKTRIVKTDNEEYDVFYSKKLAKWSEDSPEWTDESKEYSRSWEYIVRDLWKGFIIFTNTSAFEPVTFTVDEFSKTLVCAVENGMQAMPKEVIDIMCQLHPEIKDIINNNNNKEQMKIDVDEFER